ncbi:MAG: DUF971 domain-containing protein [Proteobacteria bacterium]|nr:DUF971 domain-containing protein [Pseudomonadota bacterium]
MSETIWPTELRLAADKRSLTVAFEDGVAGSVSAELLRVNSPSAEVQGHNPDEKILLAGKRNVMITGIEPIGNYAVKLVFDDGHASGIYSWTLLRDFVVQGPQWQADYEAEIARRGWSRER